ILQHPPARKFRCDFPHLAMPKLQEEISLIEAISPTKVIAIAINHENLTAAATERIIAKYERDFQLPTTDVLLHGCEKLVQALCDRFPKLNRKIKGEILAAIPAIGSK
ncbi:MAG: DUF1611 domain-containing protein, partial [Microcystis sp.]